MEDINIVSLTASLHEESGTVTFSAHPAAPSVLDPQSVNSAPTNDSGCDSETVNSKIAPPSSSLVILLKEEVETSVVKTGALSREKSGVSVRDIESKFPPSIETTPAELIKDIPLLREISVTVIETRLIVPLSSHLKISALIGNA